MKSSLLRGGAPKHVVETSEPSQASQRLKTCFHSQPFVDYSSHCFRIALRSLLTFPTSSKRLVRVNADLFMTFSSV